MSRNVTLATMLADIRTRTNMENSTFVTDAELTGYLNMEIARLWTRLAQGSGHPHFRSSQPYTVTPATSLQPLPADFYQVQEVTALIAGTAGSLRPFMAAERGSLINNGYNYLTTATKYRVQANNIEFLPITQNFSATLFYVPTQTKLANTSDVFDGYCGYEAVPIYGVCAIVKEKEESDPGFYKSLQQEAYRDIDSLIAQRDASNPETVQDVLNPLDGFTNWWFR